MKKSPLFVWYFGATVLTALLAAALLLNINARTPAIRSQSRANPALARSYEDVVKDEQHRWGHGHTAGDSSASDPGVSGSATPTPEAAYAIPK